VGTAQAPAQGSATSDDGAPTTSKHNEALVNPTLFESNLTAKRTHPRAGMTHLLRVSGSYSGKGSISSGEGAGAGVSASASVGSASGRGGSGTSTNCVCGALEGRSRGLLTSCCVTGSGIFK